MCVCAETWVGVLLSWEAAEEADVNSDLGGEYQASSTSVTNSHSVHTGCVPTCRDKWTNEVDCTYMRQ